MQQMLPVDGRAATGSASLTSSYRSNGICGRRAPQRLFPSRRIRRRQSTAYLMEVSVQHWLAASGPALSDVLTCSGSRRKLGAGACRHRPEESPALRELAAGRPAIARAIQKRPVDKACAKTLPLHLRGERDLRNDAPLARMTNLPHESRIGYPVTAVDAKILETSRPRRGVQQEEPLGPRTASIHRQRNSSTPSGVLIGAPSPVPRRVRVARASLRLSLKP